jgi:hypothetical protein
MGSILKVHNVSPKDMDGFVQHLEFQACIRNDSVVFPPQLRCVKKGSKARHAISPYTLSRSILHTSVLNCGSSTGPTNNILAPNRIHFSRRIQTYSLFIMSSMIRGRFCHLSQFKLITLLNSTVIELALLAGEIIQKINLIQ